MSPELNPSPRLDRIFDCDLLHYLHVDAVKHFSSQEEHFCRHLWSFRRLLGFLVYSCFLGMVCLFGHCMHVLFRCFNTNNGLLHLCNISISVYQYLSYWVNSKQLYDIKQWVSRTHLTIKLLLIIVQLHLSLYKMNVYKNILLCILVKHL